LRRTFWQCLCLLHAGTLLDSNSKVLQSSVIALKAAISAGVTVCLSTGKARPAAMAALQPVGLAGHVLNTRCSYHWIRQVGYSIGAFLHFSPVTTVSYIVSYEWQGFGKSAAV